MFDGHLTHQQALDRFAAPPVETGSAANGEPAIPGAEISHTLITIKDEQGNVIAEQLFPEGSSDATIEKYISEISANYTNQVRQGTAAAPGTGLGTSGNTASAPIDRYLGKSTLPCSRFNMLSGSGVNQSYIPHRCGAKHSFLYNATGTLSDDRSRDKDNRPQ